MILLPISLERELGAITYISALGLISSIFLMFAVTFEFFTNSRVVPTYSVKFEAAHWVIFDWNSIFETIPFIVFLYMYQSLIP